MDYIIIAAIILISYFLGAIPFGLIIGRAVYGTDIRQHGSGNIGATNVFRTLGPGAGIAVFVADFFKGFIPVMIVKTALATSNPDLIPLMSVLAGLIAMVGHSFSVFIKFEGGKGMSTAAGFVAAIWPGIALALFIIWISIIAITRYVSLASVTIGILLPVLVTIFDPQTPYIIFTVVAAVVATYRHRTNIGRLLAGTELKIGKKKIEEKVKGKPEVDCAE